MLVRRCQPLSAPWASVGRLFIELWNGLSRQRNKDGTVMGIMNFAELLGASEGLARYMLREGVPLVKAADMQQWEQGNCH